MAKDLTGMPEDVTIRGDNAVDGGRVITIGRKDVSGREDPVNVDTLRSKFTIDTETISWHASRTYHLLDYGALADNSTNIKSALDAFTTEASTDPVTLTLSGRNAIYYLAEDKTLPSNVTLDIRDGAQIRVNSGAVLTINGRVGAGSRQVFQCDVGGVLIRNDSADVSYTAFATSGFPATDFMSHHQGAINALWFDGADIGLKSNKALAAGKHSAHVFIPPGFYALSTTIDLGVASHIIFEGAGFIGTTLIIDADAEIIGIDCFGSDEAHVRNLRIIESTGSKKSCCMRLGGTSLKVSDCWAGNAKYGIYAHSGSGTLVYNCFAEHCDYGLWVSSRHNDSPIGLTGGTNIREFQIQNSLFHSCDIEGVHIENFFQVDVTINSGTFAVGDVVTASVSGDFTILDIDSAANRWTADRSGTVPTAGETLTGPTGTATIDTRYANLVANTKLRNVEIHCKSTDISGKGIVCKYDTGTDIDVLLFDNKDGGAEFIESKGYLISGSADRNAGFGLRIKGGYGAITKWLSHNATTDVQKLDIAIQDSVVGIAGCSLNSDTKLVMATDDPQVAATPGVTFHDSMVWDGVDDAVVMDIGTLYADNDTTTLEFTLHDYGDLTNGVLITYGTDNSNSVAIMTVNGTARFVMEKAAGVYRTALPGVWKLGKYTVAFNKLAHTITVTDPDGVETSDTSTTNGLALFSDGDLHIGKRPNGGGDEWWNGCLSTVKLKNNAGTVVHEYNGYGGLDADWADQTGSANGTVAGSPAETKATP